MLSRSRGFTFNNTLVPRTLEIVSHNSKQTLQNLPDSELGTYSQRRLVSQDELGFRLCLNSNIVFASQLLEGSNSLNDFS